MPSGGKREGAGRKPKHGKPMKPHTVRLLPEWYEVLIAEFKTLQDAIETLILNHIETK